MTLFWVVAAAIPLGVAAFVCWPLLRAAGQEQNSRRGLAVALLALLPMATVLLYQGVGEPQGIGAGRGGPTAAETPSAELPDLLEQLRARLEAQPGDVEGWLLLGRSYKTVQRYPDALAALRRAREIAPGDPRVAVELAEALIFTTADTNFSAEVRALLDEAVTADARQQKALWLQGIVAFQDGDYPLALQWWDQLSVQLEAGSEVARSVTQQMDEARRRLGQETVSWPGLDITVDAAPGLPELPATATLFVIARQPGGGGPPLGAVRIPVPEFPVSLHLDDGASMLPQRPVSSMADIEVLARLSLTGQPAAAPNDWQSAPLAVNTGAMTTAPLRLVLERQGSPGSE